MRKPILFATVALVFLALTSASAIAKDPKPTTVTIKLTDEQKKAVDKSDKSIEIKPTKEQLDLAKTTFKLAKVPVKATWTVTKKHLVDGEVHLELTSGGDFVSISQDPDIF